MPLVDGVRHGHPDVDRVERARRRLDRRELRVGVPEGHHHGRLVRLDGLGELGAGDVPVDDHRLPAQHGVGVERHTTLVRLRKRVEDERVGLFLVVHRTPLRTVQNGLVRVDDGLRQAGGAGGVHEADGVVRVVPEPVGFRQHGRRRAVLVGVHPLEVQPVEVRGDPVEPFGVGVEADGPAALDQRDGAVPLGVAVDQHGDRADLRERREVQEVLDGVRREDGDPVVRPHAPLEVPDRPALHEVVEVAQAEPVPRLAVGVGDRRERVDEGLVREGVELQHRGQQVPPADARVGEHPGAQLGAQDGLVRELHGITFCCGTTVLTPGPRMPGGTIGAALPVHRWCIGTDALRGKGLR